MEARKVTNSELAEELNNFGLSWIMGYNLTSEEAQKILDRNWLATTIDVGILRQKLTLKFICFSYAYSNLPALRGQSMGEGVRTSPEKGGGVGDTALNFQD